MSEVWRPPSWVGRFSWLGAFCLLLGACAMPAHLRSPRTQDGGEFQHSLGLDVTGPQPVALLGGDPLASGLFVLGVTPTYTLQYGLTDWWEIGGTIGMVFWRAETTVQFLESRYLDVAVGMDMALTLAPSVIDEPLMPSLAFPTMAALNLTPGFSLIGQVAPAHWLQDWFLQVGGGLDFRPTPGLTLRPHFSRLLSLPGYSSNLRGLSAYPFYVFGLDFVFPG